MMGILAELKIFLKSIVGGIILLLLLSFIFFLFPQPSSITTQVFNGMEHHLLPPGVSLIVTDPLAAFIAEMELSILISFLVLFPFFIYKIIKYITPALLKHEKRILIFSVLPSTALFFMGCAFAYYFVIPATFKILYPYALNIGATPFFSLADFVSSVLSLTMVTGTMFLLPIFMIILSSLHIISPRFWRSKLRHAVLIFLIFTAIITPDGTGITMMILLVPLCLLYLLGCLFTEKFIRKL